MNPTTRSPHARLNTPLALAAACGVATALAAPAAAQLTEPFPAVFEPQNLLPAHGGDGSLGFVAEGFGEWDLFGAAVASAGDINGDGIDDLAIVATGYTYCHHTSGCSLLHEGAAYILYGRDGTSGGFPAALRPEDADVRMHVGDARLGKLGGGTVAPLDDINGDGLDDVIIGGASSLSYVVYGATEGLPPEIDLRDLQGEVGFTISATGSGWIDASAGDVNGDGLSDVIVADRYATASGRENCGRTYVFFGRQGGFPALVSWTELDGTNGFSLFGAAAEERSGRSVASGADFNDDGIHDIIIGAPGDSRGAPEGSSYVVQGRASGTFPAEIDLAEFDVSDGFRLDGGTDSVHSGYTVSSAGDMNGDGIDDIIVGAPDRRSFSERGPGRAYVVFGREEGGPAFPPTVDLSSLNGSDGFRIDNADPSARYTGWKVARAGDINGDGLSDVVVLGSGYPGYWSYVLYGRDAGSGPGFPAVVDLTELDGSDGFRIDGLNPTTAAAAGDVNGDGADDLVVSVYGGGHGARGRAYVIYGRTPDAPCYADCDESGSLDFFDFLCFQNQFAAGDPQADCDDSGELDFFDFLCFQNAFAAGCP